VNSKQIVGDFLLLCLSLGGMRHLESYRSCDRYSVPVTAMSEQPAAIVVAPAQAQPMSGTRGSRLLTPWFDFAARALGAS
jgi:hypothetical protein